MMEMGLFKRNKAIRHQDDNDCAGKMHNKALHINKNWIIGILAILVIILSAIILSSDLFEDKNVATIISFTATILSIVLSLLAILYSYLGNIESFENLSEIRAAVAEIKATEEGIKHFISSLNLGALTVGSSGASSKVDDNKDTDNTPSNSTTKNVVVTSPSITGKASFESDPQREDGKE